MRRVKRGKENDEAGSMLSGMGRGIEDPCLQPVVERAVRSLS